MIFSDRKLTKWLKGVRPKRWWRIFGPGKFKDEKYEEAKENLISTLHDKGYRDAEIIKDTITRYSDKRIEIDLDIYDFFGIESGCNSPYGRCLGILELEQVSHVVKIFFMDFDICGHQKSLNINSIILLKPKCSTDGKSCQH